MTCISIFACARTSTCFSWAYLWWTNRLSMWISASFVIISSIWWSTIMRLSKLWLINLLIIMNSNFFKLCLQKINSISVTCIQSIFSKLFHFPISHLFCFFYLLWIKLDLSWVDSCSNTSFCICIRFKIIRVHITIIIWISLLWSFLRFTSSSSSILLSNSAFKLIKCNFF